MDDAVERAIISIGEQYTSEKGQREARRYELARDIYLRWGYYRKDAADQCIQAADEFLAVYYKDKEQPDE